MKYLEICTLMVGAGLSLQAQAPPPPEPPAAGAPDASMSGTTNGTISQLNYGPEGGIDGFVLSNNTLVQIPRDWALQLEGTLRQGEGVKVAGAQTTTPSGMLVFDAQTLTVGGKSWSLLRPTQPSPVTGNGVIRQLNYGRQGEVNGFVLQNGTFAKTPPVGASSSSVLKAGATISFSGFARTTATGKTLVDVQSITVNGQTIALNTMPPDPRPRGLRGPRGPEGGLEPPPPRPPVQPPVPPAAQ